MKNTLLLPELREYLSGFKQAEFVQFFEEEHPVVIADFLSALTPQELWEALKPISPLRRAEIFSNLDEEIQIELAETLKREELGRLLSDMSADDRVDLIKRIPEERCAAILPALAQAEREDIRKLASYDEGTAGSVMTSDYVTLSPELTASESIAKLRKEAPDKETIYYAYIIDKDRKLTGFISLKDLILSKPGIVVSDIMRKNVIFAKASDDQEEAAQTIQKYGLIALPVVNEEDVLVGIITHDDAIDIIQQEQTEDIEKFMAIAGSHEAGAYMKTTSWVHFKNRVIWIVSLAALGLVSGLIIHGFEATLMNLMILALYMPMVADTGGNTGSQAATVVIRALALKEISAKDAFKVLFKEFKVSVMLALILGTLSFAKVMFLSKGSDIKGFSLVGIAISIAVALSLQVISATMVGAMLPLAASKLKLDPAIVASPALTTIVDITGLIIYFSTAKLLLGV